MWSLLASLDAYKFEASFPFFLPLWCLVLSLHPTKICIEPKNDGFAYEPIFSVNENCDFPIIDFIHGSPPEGGVTGGGL